MAKRLQEISTGDIYPWSETWAKDPRFVEIDQVEIVVPDPFVVVTDGPAEPEPVAEPEPAADGPAKGKKGQ